MNKKLKMVITLTVSMLMMAAVVTGCKGKDKTDVNSPGTANQGETKPDTSKFVKLKSYFIGDPGNNEAEVLAEVNKVLQEKINANIEYASVSWGDWVTKLPVLLASGEPFDFIYTSNWAYYYTEGAKGAFHPLDDLLPKYGKNILKNIPEQAWEQARINGKINMIPAIIPNFQHYGAVVRGDLRKKYNIPEITNLDSFGVYLDTIKKNVPDMIPFNEKSSSVLWATFLFENDWGRTATFNNGDQGVITYDIINGGKAFDATTTKEYMDFIKKMREWSEKGYWSKNVLSNKTRSLDAYKNNQSAASVTNLGTATQIKEFVVAQNLDWEPEFFSLENGSAIERGAYVSNGTAIYRGSKNPERALMFIDLLHSDRDFHDLVMYGIKGKNYDLTSDGKLKRPDGVEPGQYSMTNTGMGLIQGKFNRVNVSRWDYVIQKEEEYDKIAVMPKYASFVMDSTPVSAELSAVNNVIATHKLPLDWGLIDPVQGLATLQQKLKEAGIEKVLAEANRQLDAFNKK
jgi:putative aldouronate transport system substrate-binding protein